MSAVYTIQIIVICLFFGYATTLASSVRYQVWEKESQNFQVMQVMGLSHSVGWLVWLFVSLCGLLLIAVVLSLLLKYGGLLPYSDVGPVFVLMITYSVSVLAFAFVLAASLSKAVAGSMLSILFYLVTFLPFIAVLILEDSLEFWHKILAVSFFN